MKSVVLLSGGLDSSVNFYEQVSRGKVLLALTFDYGQRAAVKEIAAAQKMANLAGVRHEVVALPFFKAWGKSSLTDSSLELPTAQQVSIDDLATSEKTAQSVWVPNRNGVFLNIAAGFAEALGADVIVPGFNAEEAVTFPDNSGEFLEQSTKALSYSTRNQVQVVCTTVSLNKTQIVRRGMELNMDFNLIWPCYLAGDIWCGQCESCQRSRRALLANGVKDLKWKT